MLDQQLEVELRAAQQHLAGQVRAVHGLVGGVFDIPAVLLQARQPALGVEGPAANLANGAGLLQGLVFGLGNESVEQERLETWIMGDVDKGVPLPGLYPPNAETKARYEKETKK